MQTLVACEPRLVTWVYPVSWKDKIGMGTLTIGSSGAAVMALQQALQAHGFSPGTIDGLFRARARRPPCSPSRKCEGLLEVKRGSATRPPRWGWSTRRSQMRFRAHLPGVTVQIVSQMFPGTPVANIALNLATVLQALVAPQLTEKSMVLMSLATIRAETAGFVPLDEGQSRFNTSPGGQPFGPL